MVPHNLLLGELERYGSEVWAIQWIRNWLDAHSNRIEVKSVMSGWKAVMSGVPLEVCVGTGALQHVYQWIESVGSSAPSAIFQMTLVCVVHLMQEMGGILSKGPGKA